VADGTTLLTRIHHRQTPLFVLEGRADAGPVWISEALYQERIGAPIGMVAIPPAQNDTAAYEAAVLRNAPHRRAAQAFLDFLKSPQAQAIYKSYGFGTPRT
jgi:ABC-type molybdate transport system substrate-binding protein